MNIKNISLLSLLLFTGANAILPDEILDMAFDRYAYSHDVLRKCQESKDFFGRPCQCIEEQNAATTRLAERDKVMLKMDIFLNTTVQQGEEATISGKQKAAMAKKALKTIETYKQQPDMHSKARLSKELKPQTSNNTTENQFYNDLLNTIPNEREHPFISTY